MLAALAVLCVVFLLVAGGLVYGNSRRMVTAAEWVDHTQDVLTSLRSASQLSERVDTSTRIYQLTAEPGQLDLARLNANNLEATAVHLKALVADNSEQTVNANALVLCSTELALQVNALTTKAAPVPGSISKSTPSLLLNNPVGRCQRTIGKMMELERRLLASRGHTSERVEIVSLTTDFAFIGISLATLLTLFGFLIRGAGVRKRTESRIVQTNRNLEESVQLMQEQASESALLTSSRDELQLCVNLQEVYQSASNSFARLLPETAGTLCIITNSRNMMECASSWGESLMEDSHPPESCCGLRSGQPRWRQPGVSEIQCSHFAEAGPEHYVCLPVVAYGDTLGLLYLQCTDAEGLLDIKKRMDGLHQLVQLTGMAVASMKLRMKLENQSIRDPLTNLFNRHFMEIALEREISRATRRKTTLAVFMLDVDHFKEFNDQHGHAAGDAVLKAVAGVFQTTVRTEDTACRYGGEEFTIILPEITAEDAYLRAEGLRRAIGELRVSNGKDDYGVVTMSIGVALYPEDGASGDLLLQKADEALYRAKRQGRDQVLMAVEQIFAA